MNKEINNKENRGLLGGRRCRRSQSIKCQSGRERRREGWLGNLMKSLTVFKAKALYCFPNPSSPFKKMYKCEMKIKFKHVK
jgi:hypothetical protein